MRKKDLIKKNIFYNVLLQLFNISFPFLTGAYVSRSLGALKLGEINFAQSILNWIIIITSFGIPTYGIREIAKYRDNQEKINKIFSELIILKIYITTIILTAYYLILYLTPLLKGEKKLFLIMGLGIIFNLFNIDWFFSGMEDYKIISLRNILVRILTFILIIYFIKDENDYLNYSLLLVLSQGISNIWGYCYSKKSVTFTIKSLNCFKHIRMLKIFLLSSFIISIYTLLNNILLGFWGDLQDVAFFVRARQFQSIGLAMTSAVTTVLIPRSAYYFKNNKEEYNKLLNKSLNYNYIISIPLMISLIILSVPLNVFLGGKEFELAAKPLIIIAPLVVIVSLGNWCYFQIIIPLGKEKLGTLIQLIMAVMSLISSVLLIPKYGDIGAAISLFIAETTGPCISFYILKQKRIEYKLLTNSLKKYIIAALIMGVLQLILLIKLKGFLLIVLSGIGGALVYISMLYVMKESLIFEISLIIKTKFLVKK